MGINSRLNKLEKKVEELESIKQIGSTLNSKPKKKKFIGISLFILGILFTLTIMGALISFKIVTIEHINYLYNMTA